MRPPLPSALRLALEPRVRAGSGVTLGSDVRFETAPGAEIVLGDGCALGDCARVIVRAGRVELGVGVILAERVTIVAHAGVTIGARAELGEGAVIVDFNHVFEDVELPIRLQPLKTAPVTIGAGARVGLGAAILPGVSVGAGALVGPRAVVTADVPAGGAVEGVPARPVARQATGRR
ncbi:MAG: acyltransferase [Actinomycetota bacterium]|nr:acyltransferase [Actinomycetota bacterium]